MGCGQFRELHLYDAVRIPLRIAVRRHPHVISIAKIKRNPQTRKNLGIFFDSDRFVCDLLIRREDRR